MGATEWALRAERLARARDLLETDRSVLTFGRRDGRPLVLKVAKRSDDEWKAGDVLAAVGGRGVVRVYEHDAGATLMERASPGHSLAAMAVDGADDEATTLLAATIAAMTPEPLFDGIPTVEDRGSGFDRYVASGDRRIRPCCPTLEAFTGSYAALSGAFAFSTATCTTTMSCSTGNADGSPSIPRVSSASWNAKSEPRYGTPWNAPSSSPIRS